MNRTLLSVAIATTIGWQGAAIAAPGETGMEERMQRMEQRIRDLENRLQDQHRTLAEKDQQLAELRQAAHTDGGDAGEWWPGVTIGGLVELEAMRSDGFSGDSVSDLAVAAVELAVDAQVTNWVSANVTLLYEEDDTELDVDAATITIGNADSSPLFVSGGLMAVPFGRFETLMVSDPLTLELGESIETAALIGFERDGLYAGGYLFNGDQDSGDDQIDDTGLYLGYAFENDDLASDFGVSWISNIADSDGFSGYLDDEAGLGGVIGDDVSGFAAHGLLAAGPVTLLGEYLAADRFAAGEIGFNGAGAEPSAWNLEIGYAFQLAAREAAVALGYQQTDEAVALGLPEQRIALAFSLGLYENTSLALEWARDEDYGVSDGGTGEESNTLTAQLAVEF